MRDIHMEDMAGQSLAHRAAMDATRKEAEKTSQAALDAQTDKSRELMGAYSSIDSEFLLEKCFWKLNIYLTSGRERNEG